MLKIIVWCLPVNQKEEVLRTLHEHIVHGVTQIPELEIKDEKGMFVLFPRDEMKYGLGEQILVEISSIRKQIPTDFHYRRQLAWRVGAAVKDNYPTADVLAVVEKSADAEEVSWHSTKGFDKMLVM